jgi:hypothetical protein
MVRRMIFQNPVFAVTRPFKAGVFSRLAAHSGLDEVDRTESEVTPPLVPNAGTRPILISACDALAAINEVPALG